MDAYRTAAAALAPPVAGDAVTREGGIAFATDKWTRLRNFLINGTESGSYYVGAQELTLQNANVVVDCVAEAPLRVLAMLVDISDRGLAPKNDPAIFALAVVSVKAESVIARRLVVDALPLVCRIPTHLIKWVEYRKAMGAGWGRIARRAVANWYKTKDAQKIAYHAIKYPSREGWSQGDLLRVSHVLAGGGAPTPTHDHLYRWMMGDGGPIDNTDYQLDHEVAELINRRHEIHEHVRAGDLPRAVAAAIAAIHLADLPREALPTEILDRREVWEALIQKMPATALIRNLGKMTNVGLIDGKNEGALYAVVRLTNEEYLRKARVHPIHLLAALKVYEAGHGVKGKLSWKPSKPVVNALDEAFYLAYGSVEPTGARMRVAVDVSTSMTQTVNGMPFLTAREAAGAMALVLLNTEPRAEVVAFHDRIFPNFPIRPSMRLDEVARLMDQFDAGWTFCSLPISDAMQSGREVDAFVTITDSETADSQVGRPLPSYMRVYAPTNIPTRTPAQALVDYREKTGIAARHVVVAAVANEFSLADPNDPGQIDVAGFDASVPSVIASFVREGLGGVASATTAPEEGLDFEGPTP